MCDEEYNDYLEEQNEDYFDNHADEMYEQYVSDYYDSIDDQFELIEEHDDYYLYNIKNTNIYKTVAKDNSVISYFKQYNMRHE